MTRQSPRSSKGAGAHHPEVADRGEQEYRGDEEHHSGRRSVHLPTRSAERGDGIGVFPYGKRERHHHENHTYLPPCSRQRRNGGIGGEGEVNNQNSAAYGLSFIG